MQRRNGDNDDELMALTEKLLGANPDFYTMWNIRKELFLGFKESRFVAKIFPADKGYLFHY